MCIFIAALILILLYSFSGSVELLQVAVKVDDSSVVIAEGWQVLEPLWALLGASFLIGVLAVLLIMKLIPNKEKSAATTAKKTTRAKKS